MNHFSRRRFITTTTAASVLPQFSIGKSGGSANGKVNVAVVGAGGMGGYAVSMAKNENFIAICDVDENRAGKALKENPGAKPFKDFRVMLDKMGNEIDAVMISTPDHTHFPAAMAAMEMGKHVFIQKPLAHNIWQCRTLQKAAEHYKVITQMGNQGHNFGGMHRIKEWVDADVIGDVKEVITWTNRPNKPYFVPPSSFPPKNGSVPGSLDWDLWQGPVARRPYSEDYLPIRWRGWWDYGCGSLGDIGCHTFDAPFWVLGLGMPTKVEIDREDPPGEGFITMSSVVTYHFPARDGKPPVIMKWYEKGRDAPKPKRWVNDDPLDPRGGMYMEGTKETVYHGDMRPTSPTLTPRARFMEKRKSLSEIERLPDTPGPIQEWLAAIKGAGPMPGSSFDYAARLTEVVLLGAMAQRTGKTIEWDADKMEVKGQPELAALIKEPVIEGWQYGEKLW